MNQPQPGSTEHSAPSDPQADRLRELERGFAYEFCCSVIESDLTEDEEVGAGWFDEDSDSREDELIPECVEYLTLRGLIQRDTSWPGFFAIRDESEGVR